MGVTHCREARRWSQAHGGIRDKACGNGRNRNASSATALRARELLLVLDNVEQVVAAGPEVGALLETCPRLTVLATGRMAGGGLFLKLTSS